MKYLIVSDIHGSMPALQQVLDFYKTNHCDMLCILGDILNYGPRNRLPEGLDPKSIAEHLNAMSADVVAVRGNCDSEVDQMLIDIPIMSDSMLVVDEGKRLFLTHGHIYNEEHLPKVHCDVLFYGHTHLWKLEPLAGAENASTIVCNTGSVTFPKGGNVPTFAVYEAGRIEIWQLGGGVLKTLTLA